MGSNIEKRRVRCFFCGELVPRSLHDTPPENLGDNYAVDVRKIGGKCGCICAECVDFYDSQIELDVDEIFDDQFDNENSWVSRSRPNKSTATSSKRKGKSHSSDLLEIVGKYKCLEYSLDSVATLVKKKVFGQDEAISDTLYALYHNQFANMMEELGNDPSKHKHILLIGGTGVGKTLLATTVAKAFGIPYSLSNATPITSAGYIGEKVENVLERLYEVANRNLEVAQSGLIILDEIDKKRSDASEGERDVVGKAVQQELLKLLEPSTVWINNGSVPFYTGSLTIIMMGAFVGIDEVVKKRRSSKHIGFGDADKNSHSNDKDKITVDDLINYGFIPEFVGRLSLICQLKPLSHDTIVDIIYKYLEDNLIFFKAKGFELYFNPYLVTKVADEIMLSKTGARDVESKIDEILRPALYRVFQSQGGGLCEIGENAEVEILSYSHKTKNALETISLPSIDKYVEHEDIQVAMKN